MGKDMIIKLLESQLAASNATISQLRLTIDEMSASMKSMTATIANLEALLKERDCSLEKARNQMRGMSRLAEKKSEKQHPVPEAPKTAGETARKEAERKARGNNGARRRMHFEMETVEHDVYPPGVEGRTPFSTRDTVRYRMIPPRFIKDVYHIHTMKDGERLVSARAPLAPLQNSSFDGSFIAGIAQLRYLYSMPVERIVAYFGENGFDIDKQTAHGLLKKTAALFDNLYGAMRAAVREDSYLNCDETYHKVLVDRELNDGRGSRKGYVWAIAAAHLGLVYFFYDDGSRSEEVILKELEGYSGTIQSDGLAAYKKVAARSGGKIQRLACLQHCKRVPRHEGQSRCGQDTVPGKRNLSERAQAQDRDRRVDGGRQSEMAAGICSADTLADKGDAARNQVAAGQVSSQIPNVQGCNLYAQPVGWHRGHTFRRRLLVGQQSHRENQQVHINIQKELHLLRQPRRGKTGMRLLLPGMFLPATQDKLLRISLRHPQQGGHPSADCITASLPEHSSRPLENN